MDEEILLNSATSDAVEVLSVKKKEPDNWKRYNVYTDVTDKGQQCVSASCVSVLSVVFMLCSNYRKNGKR